MEIYPDFKELLALLNDHEVEYMIVGGYALAHHGSPRYTGDIDIYVRPDKGNAQRLLNALDAFGFGSVGLQLEDFIRPDQVVQLGYPPVRIDLITTLTGVCWEEAMAGRVHGYYGGIPVNFLGRDQLVQNKRATGRAKDLADLDSLSE